MSRTQERIARWLLQLTLAAAAGLLAGVASTLFLFTLGLATEYRLAHEWLLWALPLGGLLLGLTWDRFGESIKPGTNLVLDTIHGAGKQIPPRMAPMVLLGTVWSHFFGASVGREGTAVQMGASLADSLCAAVGVDSRTRRAVLLAGVAGGFSSVFGAPIAGCAFAVEFAVVGRPSWSALFACAIAALVANAVPTGFGIEHTHYPHVVPPAFTGATLAACLGLAAAAAVITFGFIELTHFLKKNAEKRIPRRAVRAALGGGLLVLAWQLLQSSALFGLSTEMLTSAFEAHTTIAPWVPVVKLLLTATAVAFGFIGGEVVPLFVIGATLGHVLAGPFALPVDFAAALGLAAVFGAASNAPVSLAILAAELVGPQIFPWSLLVCALAFLLPGQRSIYASQRFARKTSLGRRLLHRD